MKTEVNPKRPSTVLETELKARGIHPRRLWEMRGPENTQITWVHAFALDYGIVIVETFNYDGWDAYTSLNDTKIAATVDDVIARCGAFKQNDTRPVSQQLTPGSLALFKALANDACNWDGMPLFGGNVGRSPADKGNLTDLKKHGLVKTEQEGKGGTGERLYWVIFTEAGRALAAELGCAID